MFQCLSKSLTTAGIADIFSSHLIRRFRSTYRLEYPGPITQDVDFANSILGIDKEIMQLVPFCKICLLEEYITWPAHKLAKM
jgi:hypothetical protein